VVKEVLRGSLAQINTEQKHGVLQLHQDAGPSAPPASPARGADINAQLAQARELEA
jgi:hypothetical protein